MEEHKFFQKEFMCYSMKFLSLQKEVEIDDMEYSDKIIMPQSALEHLTHFNIANPIMMKITSRRFQKFAYCGVLEFTSQKRTIFVPQWIMDNISVEDGEKVEVISVNLPKASFIKLKPLTPIFSKLSNPRIVLEYHLQNFICLYEDEIIRLKYCENEFEFLIKETEPTKAVCINNANVNLEIMEYKNQEQQNENI